MPTNFNALEKRIVELSYRYQLTHVSSCLNCVNLLDWIYANRKDNEPVIMGNGHASLAHYVVLESKGLCDAEEMVNKHGTHASRDKINGIWVSCGSLGQPETIAVGMALADKKRKVWLVTSDGAAMEGSVYESLRVAAVHCPNLVICIVFNGYGAYGEISRDDLPKYWPRSPYSTHTVDQLRYPHWLRGLAGHYLKLTEEQYKELMQ